MNEYEFIYEAPPVSEIAKKKVVRADSKDSALARFRFENGADNVIHSIKLV